VLWKNGIGNFWNRVSFPTYEEFVSADTEGKFFAGAGEEGIITRSLIIGHSLNNTNAVPPLNSNAGPPVGLATYHSAFDMKSNVLINFPHVDGKTSGAFATDDYYIRPVEKGTARTENNLLVNSFPGHRSNAAVNEDIANNFAGGFTHYVFAGALLDKHGVWGAPDSWNVYNQPFLTHGGNCTPIEPQNMGAVSCDGHYIGVFRFILENAHKGSQSTHEISVTRYDDANPDSVVGNWHVDGSQIGWLLYNMRHFAARRGGTYLLDFPSATTTPTDVAVDISNSMGASDAIVLGIRFSGALNARVYGSTYSDYMDSNHGNSIGSPIKHDYVSVASKQDVIDSASETFWQDTVNNVVWIKVRSGGIQQWLSTTDPNSEQVLYNLFHLRVW
jgi:hypothetical protein